MNQELLDLLKRVLQDLKSAGANKSATVVCVLIGSIYAGTDGELAALCADFAKSQLRKLSL
jgi:hypothetical protein